MRANRELLEFSLCSDLRRTAAFQKNNWRLKIIRTKSFDAEKSMEMELRQRAGRRPKWATLSTNGALSIDEFRWNAEFSAEFFTV